MSRCKYRESKNQVFAAFGENLVLLTHQLPITNYQLPITNYHLPLTNYQLAPHALLMVTNTIGLRFVCS